MIAKIIFNLLFLSPIHSIKFNSFKHLMHEMEEMKSSLSLADIVRCQAYWLEQKLDNFDQNNNFTWKMRYFERLDFWKLAGPIYIFLGGESELLPCSLKVGLTVELASETNGALYAVEHRYYGKSLPLRVTKVNDFRYLSAKQALADYAHFIRTIKSNPMFRYSKVVVVGGSYAGNLAAWMRLLYPELVNAAISSSAPVLAKKDFYEYLEKVGDDYYLYGTVGCWKAINNRFKWYDSLFKSEVGIEKLKEDENICHENNMYIQENKFNFFLNKIQNFWFKAQYGNTYFIERHCLNWNTRKEVLQSDECMCFNQKKSCFDYEYNSKTLDHNIDHNFVGWYYQTCNEFGYFASTSSDRQPFTNNLPIEFFIKNCIRRFGPEFNDTRIEKGVKDVNKMYGGLKPNVTNVVFVNGELDPWSRLGILKDLSPDAPAIVIPRASHTRDLQATSVNDEPELIEARKNIKDWIKKWIGDFVEK